MRWLMSVFLCVSVSAWAESPIEEVDALVCNEPGMMVVPDGHKASSSEMLETQRLVEAYIQTTQQFLNCLLASEEAQGEAMTFEQKKASITRYNLAVARLEGVVDSFNQQLRSYKKTNAN